MLLCPKTISRIKIPFQPTDKSLFNKLVFIDFYHHKLSDTLPENDI